MSHPGLSGAGLVSLNRFDHRCVMCVMACAAQRLSVLQVTMPRMCEDCTKKQASFGTEVERKRRWCAPCGKAHGAISLLKKKTPLQKKRAHKMCEDCTKKQARLGL
jgi:hypothetical protein